MESKTLEPTLNQESPVEPVSIEKKLRVNCEGKLFVPWNQLRWIQDDLKEFETPEDRQKLMDLIVKDGIDFAFTVWWGTAPGEASPFWWIIDGHGRQSIIQDLVERQGYECPDLPCVQHFAASFEEARLKVLSSSSSFHKMTPQGLHNFMLTQKLPMEAIGKYSFPAINLQQFQVDFGGMPLNADPIPEDQKPTPNLADRFLVPPFSILDARQGYWLERKRSWLRLGIQSEVGRGENLLKMSDTMLEPDPEKREAMQEARTLGARSANLDVDSHQYRNEKRDGSLGDIASNQSDLYDKMKNKSKANQMTGWVQEKKAEGELPHGQLNANTAGSGTSIFDPVLCELIYRWFSPQGGQVLDPFAGGSVRGIVAGKLGRSYVGIDLREEQVAANREQAEKICANGMMPRWICESSVNIHELPGLESDLVFSCPPYADLEVYSEDPRDLSTMDYEAFRTFYRDIIAKAVAQLRPNRFACFVVGEVREKNANGFYRNFVRDTVEAFELAGARFYNEMILITSCGTLPLRAGRVFTATRKIGKTHQNCLVFVKGDPREATKACGEISIEELAEMFEPAITVDDAIQDCE